MLKSLQQSRGVDETSATTSVFAALASAASEGPAERRNDVAVAGDEYTVVGEDMYWLDGRRITRLLESDASSYLCKRVCPFVRPLVSRSVDHAFMRTGK